MKTLAVIAVAGLAGVATANPAALSHNTDGVRSASVVDITDMVNISLARGTGGNQIDITLNADVDSFGGLGDASNVLLAVDVASALGSPGAGFSIFGLGWDVTLASNDPSWLSEIAVGITDADNALPGGDVILRPGIADGFSGGDTNYSSGGILDLGDNGIPDIAISNGVILLEFYETFDDAAVGPDGVWRAGSVLSFDTDAVPAPGAILVAGLGGLVASRRRR